MNVNKKWTQKEKDLLIAYSWEDESDTIEERLQHARYMLHYESDYNFPLRSLSSLKSMFYKELKKLKQK